MMLFLTISTVLLTCLTLGLAVIVFALARQIGVLHERTAPIGQQPVLAGLQVGQALPRITARLLDDSPFPLGGMHTTAVRLHSLMPTTICQKIFTHRSSGWALIQS